MRLHPIKTSAITLLLLTVLQPLAAAVEPGEGSTNATYGPSAFSAYFENDTFVGTDKHYTNAVKLSWMSRDLLAYEHDPTLRPWVTDFLSRFQFIRNREDPELRYNVVLSLGQNIYTPENTRAEELLEDDRPYAAWLYGAVALHAKTRNLLDSFEVSLGAVGPIAMGEVAQNNVHDMIDDLRAQGWDNQLEDEPGLMLTWLRAVRPNIYPSEGLGWDLILRYGATLGNILTYANAGGEARLGWNIPADFGSSRIRPGGGLAASGEKPRTGFGGYLFADLDARLVGRNIFLDGNTFRDSHRVNKKYLVADLSAGFSLFYESFRMTYAWVYRTDEFDGQEGGGQFFGSVSFTYLY
jgi:hypothetical protein